jgi:hypothetical protein
MISHRSLAQRSVALGLRAVFSAASLAMVPVAVAQDDEMSADESGTGLWMGAIEESSSQDKMVPTKSGGEADVAGSYSVQDGDTLWDISSKQLGNAYEWPRLWSYNPEITNPHWIYPGTVLKLASADAAALGAQQFDQGGSTAGMPGGPGGANSMRRTTMRVGDVYLGDEAFMDADALRDAGYIAGSHRDQMFLSPTDWGYVRFPGKAPVSPGSLLTVWRELKETDVMPKQEGKVVRIQGVVKLMDYDEKKRLGRIQVIEALDPLERGFRLSVAPRRFYTTSPKVASRTVDAKIIAMIRPLELAGSHQLFFINKGADDGVELGTRMFVVRKGDPWIERFYGDFEHSGAIETDYERPSQDELLEEIEAEARVVDVRRKTATLWMTRATVEIELADRIKSIQGR